MIEIFVFICGLFFGGLISSRKWTANADDYRRIEHCGKLYKVLHDKDWHGA